jgi:hypothetical protein
VRLLVCGSRTFADERIVRIVMQGADWVSDAQLEALTLIHGDADGADRLAAEQAQESGSFIEPYPADWGRHGRAAGPIRNRRMLDEGKPDLVLAFVDKPIVGSRGTLDMVRRARRAGIPTYVVEAS